MMDNLLLIVGLIILLLFLYSMFNKDTVEGFTTAISYPYYQTTCQCAGVPDETLCTTCSNCTWEIGADGTGRCIPYYNYGYNWWNPFSWYGSYSYPYYSDYSYTYPYYYGYGIGNRWNNWGTNRYGHRGSFGGHGGRGGRGGHGGRR